MTIRSSENGPSIPAEVSSALPVANERGFALILVLVILLLLSIVGASILATSTSELKMSGLSRTTEETFYAADAAMEFGQTSSIIYNSLLPVAGNVWPVAGSGVLLDANGNPTQTASTDRNYNELPVNGRKVKVRVSYASTGPVPAGFGTESDSGLGSGTGFKANFYVVDVKSETSNTSVVELESTVARVVPK